MAQYYDRYDGFRDNNGNKPLPFINIPSRSTDKKIVYKLGKTRFDRLSEDYYGNPYHGFLILLANPKHGGLEFLIQDGDVIRIPFPFNDAIERYAQEVEKYKKLYGKQE